MLNHKKSNKHFEESRRFLAGGVSSSGRLTTEMPPLAFQKGRGSRIYDLDGNEYIDYVIAWGPLILGHSPPSVIDAVKKQLDLGTLFGSATPEESVLSRMVCERFPSVDLVRFTNSASEAVHISLRLARAFTGKDIIVKFEGAYHGWFDNMLVGIHPDSKKLIGLEHSPHALLEQPGIPRNILENIRIVPWNRSDIVEKTIQRHANDIAAIIVEPVMCNCGVIPPVDGFLQELREITRKYEVVLIFDETITGFRTAFDGAQGYYDVTPDLTVFGKGIGGGFPIAGFGGITDIMGLVAEGRVLHQGTYNSNSLCVVAAIATLKELGKDNGAVYQKMTKMGKRLMEGIEQIFTKNDLPVVMQGPGPFFSSFFTDKPVTSYRDTFVLNTSLYAQFWLKLLDLGIRIWTSARGLWYLTAAHTEEDIDITLDAVERVVKELKKTSVP
jgi:glutamate-1-semialdehyde 2,1-aminomutase